MNGGGEVVDESGLAEFVPVCEEVGVIGEWDVVRDPCGPGIVEVVQVGDDGTSTISTQTPEPIVVDFGGCEVMLLRYKCG